MLGKGTFLKKKQEKRRKLLDKTYHRRRRTSIMNLSVYFSYKFWHSILSKSCYWGPRILRILIPAILALGILFTAFCLSPWTRFWRQLAKEVSPCFFAISMNPLVWGWIFIAAFGILYYNRYKQVLYSLLMIVLGGFSALFLSARCIWPVPMDREAASLTMLNNLLTGVNPYAIDVLPGGTFVYGILGPLSAVPLSYIRGFNRL